MEMDPAPLHKECLTLLEISSKKSEWIRTEPTVDRHHILMPVDHLSTKYFDSIPIKSSPRTPHPRQYMGRPWHSHINPSSITNKPLSIIPKSFPSMSRMVGGGTRQRTFLLKNQSMELRHSFRIRIRTRPKSSRIRQIRRGRDAQVKGAIRILYFPVP